MVDSHGTIAGMMNAEQWKSLLAILLKVFKDTYFYPLNNVLLVYSCIHTIGLIGHLFGHYTRISAMYLAANDARFWELFNSGDPLESL